MSKIMYKTGGQKRIEEIEILRETEHNAWYMGTDWHGRPKEQRIAKHTRFSKLHNTWNEAKNHLLVAATNRLQVLKLQVTKAQTRVDEIKNLTK